MGLFGGSWDFGDLVRWEVYYRCGVCYLGVGVMDVIEVVGFYFILFFSILLKLVRS